MSKILMLFVFLMTAVCWGLPAHAGQSPWASTDHAQMRLLTAIDSIAPEATEFEAALHMRMDDGWHSYWRQPGDAGAPPRFIWEKSENVSNIKVSWQAPKRYDEFGFQTFGYEKDVYFPVVVKLQKPGALTSFNVDVQTMVCSDICIPQSFTLSVSLSAGDGAPSAQSKTIEFEKKRIPLFENTKALSIDNIVTGPDALVVNVTAQNGFEKGDVFAYAPDIVFTKIPQITIDNADKNKAMITLPKPDGIENLSAALAGKELSVTVVNGRDAIEQVAKF